LKNILEFIPLVIFFIAYKKAGIITATLALVVTSLISFTILTYQTKKVAMMPLISAVLLGFFGFLTWYMQDPVFIKIKPTIINLLFGTIFVGGYLFKKPLFKYILQDAIIMDDPAWLTMTLRWGLFFIFLGGLNEFIWRGFSEDFWVNFKVFGMLPITIAFTLSQAPFMMRNMRK